MADEGSSQCQSCEAGKYGAVCDMCARGMYRPGGNAISAVTCFACPTGTFQNAEGQASCLPCTPGQFSNATGLLQCHECAAGRASKIVARNNTCDICPAGEYQANGGSTLCQKCTPGRYQVEEEQKQCLDCEIGKSSSLKSRTTGCVRVFFSCWCGVCVLCVLPHVCSIP
jgi:hypothetical protein